MAPGDDHGRVAVDLRLDDEEHGRRIGRVLKALERAKLERDTLVIFTSDNGGERYSFNWPFSFQKLYLWEGGTRVPAIVRWPGVIPAGQVTEQAAITMDWTATILAAAGAAPDPAYPLDGEDLMRCVLASGPSTIDAVLARRRLRRRSRRTLEVPQGDGARASVRSVDRPGEKNDLRTTHADRFAQIAAQFAAWNAQMLPRLSPAMNTIANAT